MRIYKKSALNILKTHMKVFISYSHKDKRYRAQLDTHLALLKREGVIEDYEDLLKKMERGKN